MLFFEQQRILKKVHSFHSNIKQHNSDDNDKKCFFSTKSAYKE